MLARFAAMDSSTQRRKPVDRWPAFTPIELLVAIAILAVVASLLLPSLARGNEQARRVKCMSNLRQWGIAHILSAQDNSEKLMSTVVDNGSYVHPTVLSIRASHDQSFLSVEAIAPYLGGKDESDLLTGGISWCPSMPKPSPEAIRTEAETWLHMEMRARLTPPKTAVLGEPTSSRFRQETGKDWRMWSSMSFMGQWVSVGDEIEG